MTGAPPDEMDLTAAATAMAQQSSFIRAARKHAGKDPSAVHDPQRAASSRVVDGKEPDSSGSVSPTPLPAANEPAPSGGDNQPATPVSTNKATATPSPSTVRVKVGDKELEMPVDLLGSYIEKAQRAEAAIAEAETIKKVKVTDDAVALAVANWAKTATPEQTRQMRQIMSGKALETPQRDPLDDTMPDAALPADSDAIARLKEELTPALGAIQQLVERENQRSAEKAEGDRLASVQALMGRYEAFKQDPGLAGLALRSIKNALAAKPDQDVVKLVAEHASEYGNFHLTRKSSTTAAGSTSAATPDTKDPGAASRPALTGKDLLNKGVLNAVLRSLQGASR